MSPWLTLAGMNLKLAYLRTCYLFACRLSIATLWKCGVDIWTCGFWKPNSPTQDFVRELESSMSNSRGERPSVDPILRCFVSRGGPLEWCHFLPFPSISRICAFPDPDSGLPIDQTSPQPVAFRLHLDMPQPKLCNVSKDSKAGHLKKKTTLNTRTLWTAHYINQYGLWIIEWSLYSYQSYIIIVACFFCKEIANCAIKLLVQSCRESSCTLWDSGELDHLGSSIYFS